LGAATRDPRRTAVAIAATDHPAILATARSLAATAPSIQARELPVDARGLLLPETAAELLADGAVSVASAALVNNETGARQDLPVGGVSTGGCPQRRVRSGTLDLAHAAAFAAALRGTLAEREQEAQRVRALARRLRAGIAAIDPEARFPLAEDSPQSGHIVHV